MTDDELQDWVREELMWYPKVDSAAVVVSASDGEVTLRGTLGSFRQKREAQKVAERVYGVTSVHNKIEVRILDEHGRQHADLRGAVLQGAVAGPTLLAYVFIVGPAFAVVGLWLFQRHEERFAIEL